VRPFKKIEGENRFRLFRKAFSKIDLCSFFEIKHSREEKQEKSFYDNILG
jgi:hypothetical protein